MVKWVLFNCKINNLFGAMFALALLSNYLFMHWVYLRELGTADDVDRLLLDIQRNKNAKHTAMTG
jgi:hypothetical protein